MQLELPEPDLSRYKSPQQRIRTITESWGESNLYCVNCASDRLRRLRANTPASDFACPQCEALFQLKSRGQRIGGTLADAAYSSMREALMQDRTPNLLALHYQLKQRKVVNLLLIPRFALSLSALKKRKPLRPSAERSGWVGCSIVLTNIPSDARISLVVEGVAEDPTKVRRQYERLKPLANIPTDVRGWTLDVLNLLHLLGKQEFSLSDAYTLEPQLASLHPANRHIRDKIRQQLQVLRDLGLLDFLGGGSYRLR